MKAYSKGSEEEQITLARKYYKDVVNSNYKDDYIAVNNEGDKLVPVFNQLVLISEQRAFEIQQVDYADRFSVFTQIDSSVGLAEKMTEEKHILRE